MARLILAHDLGTTGNKASLYDEGGHLLAKSFYGYDTQYPRIGWVEQNPDDWWRAVVVSTQDLLASSKVSPRDIACISFSGQMMGCLPVDRKGRPLRNSLIWADLRGTSQAGRLERAVGQQTVYRITGHRASASYSAAKIMWIKDNEPDVYADTYKFLHAKDYVVLKLTGTTATDYSDASGMNLFDISSHSWSPVLVDGAGLDPEKLPDPHPSTDVVGEVSVTAAKDTGLAPGTPVVIGGGDGPCAAVGAGVVREGTAYNYVGSSSWIGLATNEPILDPEMRTFNWVHLDPNMYSPTGTMQAAGGSYNWLRHNVCPLECKAAADLEISPYDVMNIEVESVPAGAMNLIYLPYLLGERSPHWNPNARGAFIGLTQKHTRPHIIRAVLEGITFNLRIILEAFERQAKTDSIRVIGGGAKGRVWAQIMADIYGKPILRPRFLDEATSLGAAIAGGIGVGLFEGFEVAEDLVEIVEEINPRADNREQYERLYPIFKRSYEALVSVFDELAKLDEQ